MELEQAIQRVNEATEQGIGRSLSEVEIALFTGAWEDETYEQIAARSGYSLNYLQRDIGPKFWKLLSQTFDRKLNKINLRGVFSQLTPTEIVSTPPIQESPSVSTSIDWGEAIDISTFYGRTQELETLQQWIDVDNCRLVALLGMGGIGKSSLATKISQKLQGRFELIIWRSLRNAPPFKDLLGDIVPFLSRQQDAQATPERLLYWLRNYRCLLVLDNLETILQPGDRVGYYQPGYEAYGELFQLLGETHHQSCILLTSREKPTEISSFETEDGKVRSLSLIGCSQAATAILDTKKLSGTLEQRQQLCQLYSDNPLAVKLVASSIQELFDGEIDLFLEQNTVIFQNVRRLLERQFQRLSSLEQTVMYWLAINREWTRIAELESDIIPSVPRMKLLEALESLRWRSLIEKKSASYTQQPVVMEYITDRLIENVAAELISVNLSLFVSHAPIKTTVKDYVRESQIRLILEPIAARVRTHFNSAQAVEQQLQNVLRQLRNSETQFNSYSAGNLLNLCLHCQLDLAKYDFSNLAIRQVNFQGKQVSQLNLAHATLQNCLFTQTFAGITAVMFSPDSQILALGDSDGTIQLWQTQFVQDTAAEKALLDLEQPYLTLSGHVGWIHDLAWHPNGKRLVSGCGGDYTVKIWDAPTGTCLAVLQGHQTTIWSVAWSPDGNLIASGSGDRAIKIWNAETGECLKTLQAHDNLVYSVDWHPNNLILASSSEDRTIRLWDVESGKCLKTLKNVGAWVRRIAWSPDGKMLASGSSDYIRLWDGETGKLLKTLVGHSVWIDAIAWSPDGKTLASSSSDRTIKLWNVVTGECLYTLQGHCDAIWGLTWSANGKTLVSGSNDQTVRFWNSDIGQCRRTLSGYTNWMGNVVWSPDGTKLANSSTDRTVKVWDSTTGQCIKTLTGHQGWVVSVAWSPSQPVLASSGTDTTIKLWDANTGKCFRTLHGHVSWIWSVDWSPDGQSLASGSSMNDLSARIWNPETGECLHVLAGHQSWIWLVRWSPDGRILATGGDDQRVNLWDVQTGNCLRTLHDDRLLGAAIAWSPDSKWLATSSTDGAVRIWNAQTGVCERELCGHQALVWAIAWSPDGKTLASSSQDSTIKLWNLETIDCIRTLSGHQSLVWDVSWNPKADILTSCGTDQTIRLWDILTGECLKVMRSDRPYEGTNITGVSGLTEAQKATLKALGAVEQID